MKDSHFRTPRNISDCTFPCGYQIDPPKDYCKVTRAEYIGGIVLAFAIGVGLAAWLVAWWSS